MISPMPAARVQPRLRLALGALVVTLFCIPQPSEAQGLVKGVQQGAEAGNKAAGPVGGVLGGAIGGVVGVFTGVLGVGGKRQRASRPSERRQADRGPAKTAKATKGAKDRPQSRRRFSRSRANRN